MEEEKVVDGFILAALKDSPAGVRCGNMPRLVSKKAGRVISPTIVDRRVEHLVAEGKCVRKERTVQATFTGRFGDRKGQKPEVVCMLFAAPESK